MRINQIIAVCISVLTGLGIIDIYIGRITSANEFNLISGIKSGNLITIVIFGVSPQGQVVLFDLNRHVIARAMGNISYDLVGQCSRCLKDASMHVEGELEAYFQTEEDYEDYRYANGVVDLTQAVEDALMASMPFSISCGEDCEGLSYKED